MLRFQSTFPRGERRHRYQILRTKNRFQSTFPRGERRTGGSQAVAACNFNPRSLVGNDGLHFHRDWRRFISIHVPSWGTTQCLANTRRMRLFQSTFPRGERRRRWICSTEEGNFNPRSLVGNDLHDLVSLAGQHYFNPRSLVGNDCHVADVSPAAAISIHVPSWGTTCLHLKFFHCLTISIHVPSWGTTYTEIQKI